ncbi:MAG: GDP-L-fucose synthase family protein [Alphaproteobacteria bacterium]
MGTAWLDQPYDLSTKRIWVAGHAGMVGAALCRRLAGDCREVLTISHDDLDLRDQGAVNNWMAENKPDVIVIAAAKVGGIMANSMQPAAFFYDNMMIVANIMHAAHKNKTSRLLFLGSSCIYPRNSEQPIKEDSLLSGALEPTNEGYALAKIAGLKMAEYYRAQYGCDFISAMPCNLYGVGDTYDAEQSHVIPAMIMKIDKALEERAPSVTLWGSGTPLREFLYVDDLADALILLLRRYNGAQHINVGSGEEVSIKSLAEKVRDVVGYKGKGGIVFDPSKPDGMPRKVLDCQRLLDAGWHPKTCLGDGLVQCYQDYKRLKSL